MIKKYTYKKNKYKSLIKVILPSLLFLVMLFSLFYVSNNEKIIVSLMNRFYEGTELEEDNWEVSTVFYDSSVNDGKTPLTEINWDASDGGFGVGQTRTITVQINYKNSNCQNNFNAGDLNIIVPSLVDSNSNINTVVSIGANDGTHIGFDWSVTYDNFANLYKFTNDVKYEKNTNFEGSILINYIMTPNEEDPEKYEDECLHELNKDVNAVIISSLPQDRVNLYHRYNTDFYYENSDYNYYLFNFTSGLLYSGNNEIIYETLNKNDTIKCNKTNSCQLKNYSPIIGYDFLKVYFGQMEINETFYATVDCYNALAISDNINFSYKRKYTHTWNRYNYVLTKKANKVKALDGIENTNDYYWVNYNFSTKDSAYAEYHGLNLYSKSETPFYIYDELPEDVVVYVKGNMIEPYENNTYRFEIAGRRRNVSGNFSYTTRSVDVIVGYPKSHYNGSNMVMTNEARLYAMYASDEEYTFQSLDSVDIDLNDFSTYNTDGLYSISKTIAENYINEGPVPCSNCGTIRYYQAIAEDADYLKDGNIFAFNMDHSVYYTGKLLTVKFGDDYLTAKTNSDIYEKLADGEYHFNAIKIRSINNSYGESIIDKYNWKVYVKKANSNNYELYKENISLGNLKFEEDDNVVAYYLYAEDLSDSVIIRYYTYINVSKQNIAETGEIYNYAYSKVYFKNGNNLVLQNSASEEDYNNFKDGISLKEFDINNDNNYIQRAKASSNWQYFTLSQPRATLSIVKYNSSIIQDDSDQSFKINYSIRPKIESQSGQNYEYNEAFKDLYDESYRVGGYYIYDLLPQGMSLSSSKEEILNSLNIYMDSGNTIMDESFEAVSSSSFKSQILNNSFSVDDISIINNWNGTNRTLLKINVDFSNNKIFFFGTKHYKKYMMFELNYDVKVSYDDYIEFGNRYNNEVFMEKHDGEIVNYSYTRADNLDLNENDNITESLAYASREIVLNPAFSTNQDVQVSVQSGLGNFDTSKVDVLNNSEYTYKLRARTGSNDVTNLVIYDSLENYAKDPNMAFIDSAKGYHKWKGEFLGIDTSYAESKGFTIRTYYSENDQPGSLKDDNSWQLYTDSVDKTNVKSLAFEYLDENNNPAVLPANFITYVLIRMKSPSDENLKTLAYNGCWTEWKAIDSLTGNPIDFITGINSNIVKVALPNSVEPQDIDLEINKYWKDKNNSLGIRPDTINIQVIPDGDITKAIDVPLGTTNIDSNNSNHWKTTISVPKTDLDGNIIAYTIREDETILDNGYNYTPEISDNFITNTLMKEIELKKIWKDNTNAYLTRPSNVTYKIKQNNNLYREVTFTGDYSTNEWTKTITVPVYDENGIEYNYSLEEVNVENYTSSCENYTCTNTLSGNDTLNIKKNWKDNNNSYNTRPSSIMVNVLQNNNTYRGVTLTSSNNWTNTVTVPKYDSNGVKYTYTIEEEQVEEYGLVEYNQNTFNITNTLKTNTNLTITKNWVDDNNSLNTRPNELKITLLQNNNEYQELTLTGNTNTWTTTIEVPKYDNNQKKYTYSIREKTDNLNSDYSDITYSEEELSVTNKLNKKQDLTVKKKWLDQDNKYLTRPSKVNINILRDGEIFRTMELSGNSNTWTHTINDVDVYDSNGKKYNYTLEEETLEKYGKVTYDNTNLEITNELTEIPKVTLYFTVVNGYVDPVTGEMKYDDFGLNEIMKKYNINPEDEYIFTFELQNTITGQIYEGKLSTQGILEFDDLPYGEYKAIEGDDKLFEFVDMLEIEEVNGVKFEKRGKEGYITIEPTGENIMYGAKIINKIEAPIVNPKTNLKGLFLLLTILIITIISFIFIKKKKDYIN